MTLEEEKKCRPKESGRMVGQGGECRDRQWASEWMDGGGGWIMGK